MTGKELVQLLIANGYNVDRINGSHYILEKRGCPSLTIPVHARRDVAPGLLNSILKKAGIK